MTWFHLGTAGHDASAESGDPVASSGVCGTPSEDGELDWQNCGVLMEDCDRVSMHECVLGNINLKSATQLNQSVLLPGDWHEHGST